MIQRRSRILLNFMRIAESSLRLETGDQAFCGRRKRNQKEAARFVVEFKRTGIDNDKGSVNSVVNPVT